MFGRHKLLAALAATLAAADPATLDGSWRPLAEGALGCNTQLANLPEPWSNDPGKVQAVSDLGLGSVRYPGGTVCMSWDHRRDRLFPEKAAATASTDGWVDLAKTIGGAGYDLIKNGAGQVNSLRDLKHLVDTTGVTPIFVVNLLTPGWDYYRSRLDASAPVEVPTPASPPWNGIDLWTEMLDERIQRAMEMLDRARELGIPVRCIELGNELYWNGAPYFTEAFPDADTDGDGQTDNGKAYAIAANRFATAIRSGVTSINVRRGFFGLRPEKNDDSHITGFPDARICAVAVDDDVPPGSGNTNPYLARRRFWNTAIVPALDRQLIDALSLHIFHRSGSTVTMDPDGVVGAVDLLRQAQTASFGYYRADTLFNAAPPWPIWYTETHLNKDVDTSEAWGNDLLNASHFFHLLRTTPVERLMFGSFRRLTEETAPELVTGRNAKGVALSPLFHAARGKNQWVPLALPAATPLSPGGHPLVAGLAFRDAGSGRREAALMNLTANAQVYDLSAAIGPGQARVRSATAALDDDAPVEVEAVQAIASVTLPAWSVVLVRPALPSVAITSPQWDGPAWKVGSSVALAASASPDPVGGLLSRVEFLIDGAVVGTDRAAPYTSSWIAAPGAHQVVARAVCTDGTRSESLPVTVHGVTPVAVAVDGAGTRYPPLVPRIGANVQWDADSAGNRRILANAAASGSPLVSALVQIKYHADDAKGSEPKATMGPQPLFWRDSSGAVQSRTDSDLAGLLAASRAAGVVTLVQCAGTPTDNGVFSLSQDYQPAGQPTDYTYKYPLPDPPQIPELGDALARWSQPVRATGTGPLWWCYWQEPSHTIFNRVPGEVGFEEAMRRYGMLLANIAATQRQLDPDAVVTGGQFNEADGQAKDLDGANYKKFIDAYLPAIDEVKRLRGLNSGLDLFTIQDYEALLPDRLGRVMTNARIALAARRWNATPAAFNEFDLAKRTGPSRDYDTSAGAAEHLTALSKIAETPDVHAVCLTPYVFDQVLSGPNPEPLKPVMHAVRFLNAMPGLRRPMTASGVVQGLAAADASSTAIVVWNTADTPQLVDLSCAALPQADGSLEILRMGYDRQPAAAGSAAVAGGSCNLAGIDLPPHGVVFIRGGPSPSWRNLLSGAEARRGWTWCDRDVADPQQRPDGMGHWDQRRGILTAAVAGPGATGLAGVVLGGVAVQDRYRIRLGVESSGPVADAEIRVDWLDRERSLKSVVYRPGVGFGWSEVTDPWPAPASSIGARTRTVRDGLALPIVEDAPSGWGAADGSARRVRLSLVLKADAPATLRVQLDDQRPNRPPVVEGALAATTTGVPVSLAVNVTDADQDAVVLRGTAAHGTVSFVGRTMTWAPTSAWSGTETVSVIANDGIADSLTATVVITVTPPANTAPTLTTVTASPSSTTVALSAVAEDDGGAAGLSYTWSLLAAPLDATVVFNNNGSSTARNAVATVTRAGTYQFRVTVRDGGGLFVARDVSATIVAAVTAVTVAPATVALISGTMQTFTAAVADQFGQPMDPVITWTAGSGAITGAGVFTAPDSAGQVAITAATGGKSGTATATVTRAGGPVTGTAIIACDDAYEFHVDGVLVGTGSSWRTAQTWALSFPANSTHVLAIKAIDKGGAGGLLAEVVLDGVTFSSDSSWKATITDPGATWTQLGHGDGAWPAAATYGIYGTSPYGTGVGGMPTNATARWIWGGDRNKADVVWLRRTVTIGSGGGGALLPLGQLIATADNRFTAYLDGVSIATGQSWNKASVGASNLLSAGEHVLAIAATNDSPGAAGILAEWRIGELRIGSGSGWRCATTAVADWNTLTFDDAAWSRAVDLGALGAKPWGTNIGGMPADTPAHWIWSSDTSAQMVVFRYRFSVAAQATTVTSVPFSPRTDGPTLIIEGIELRGASWTMPLLAPPISEPHQAQTPAGSMRILLDNTLDAEIDPAPAPRTEPG